MPISEEKIERRGNYLFKLQALDQSYLVDWRKSLLFRVLQTMETLRKTKFSYVTHFLRKETEYGVGIKGAGCSCQEWYVALDNMVGVWTIYNGLIVTNHVNI